MKQATSQLLPASADSLARIHTAEAMGVLIDAMNGDIPGIKPAERLKAATTILERGHGKAVQAVISVPARAAVAAKLAAMSDEALLQIAQGGGGGPSRGPQGTGESAGPIEDEAHSFWPIATVTPAEMRSAVDAEYEDAYDPCA